MALEDEVKTLITAVNGFLSEAKAERDALTAKDAKITEESITAEKALEAQAKVLGTDGLTKTFSESLLEGIKAGRYDVDEQIAAFTALRSEILEESKANDNSHEMTNESISFGRPPAGKPLDLTIKGWGK